MPQEHEFAHMEWFELIVVFNTLLKSIDTVRAQLDNDDLDDDVQYALDEELNDYTTLLRRLQARYAAIPTKGELSPGLKKRLQEFC